MPVANLTAVANLALDLIGEPYLTDYETDTGTAAEAVRLHLSQCLETVLEGHVWSFATRTAELASVSLVETTATLQPDMSNNPDLLLLTAVTPGDPGNLIEFEIVITPGEVSGQVVTVSITGATIAPLLTFSGGNITLDALISAIETSAAEIVTPTLVEGATGDEVIADHAATIALEQAATFLSGGYTPPVLPPAYVTAWYLPDNCLRLTRLNGLDADAPESRFEIQGRQLLLEYSEEDPPVISFIANDAPISEWPTTFTDALVFLLASRLAPKLTQDRQLAADLLGRHEQALGKARAKDSRETRSKENHGPRQLAARSGLVGARYGKRLRDAAAAPAAAPTAAPDLDTIFNENL